MNHTAEQNGLGAPPELSISGPVAQITLRRPSVHNRIDSADLALLQGYVERLNADAAVRVLVVTAIGASFSSGFDLGDFDGQIRSGGDTAMERFTDALESMRPVTIAKLNGPVYGGSTDLALACDFRIATTECRMFMPAARLGLHYYGHGLRRWTARLGAQTAKRLFLTAEQIDAAEMLRIGFVDQVVAADRLDDCTRRMVDKLLAMAPIALLGMKQVLNEIANGEYDHSRANALHKSSVQTRDMQEALDAFAQGRKPTFIGA